ncbi:hypothetical protein DE4585_02666 [Mycobacteroides salmoniphilum]|uniref:DUF3558 domain-containing protein n=1 Tax=Mycobacteroides salmoniphilum TaxID=404941 RepID=A0A4R8S0S1_9MYCO|nr:hypothetical protein DE4585_02666 [Mycobacteroides salmoniphilum]
MLLVSSCSPESTQGEAVKAGDTSQSSGPLPSYRERVSPETRRELDYSANLRKIDPCSLVDLNAAARLGKVKYVGTDSALSDCLIEFDVPKTGADSDAVPGLPQSISVGTRAQDDGNGPRLMTDEGMCHGWVATGQQRRFGAELLGYVLVMSGFQSVRSMRPGCEELSLVIDASRPLISHPGERSASQKLAQAKLPRLDPCGALDVVTAGQKIEVLSAETPYECDFRNAGDYSNQSRFDISFWNAKLAQTPHPADLDPKYTKIRGALSIVEQSAYQCTVNSYVGLDDPTVGRDETSALPQWVDVIKVTGKPESGCTKVVSVATEAVRQYQEAS